MPVTKSISSRACTRHAINYITNPEKTQNGKYVEGILCDPRNATEEFAQVRQFYDKTDGRQYKHYILSFDPKADKQPTADEVLEIAEKVVTETAHLQGFQSVVAVHDDRDHMHAHIIVNSVSIATGRKLHETKADLQNMKDVQNSICYQHGYDAPDHTKTLERIDPSERDSFIENTHAYDSNKYRAIKKDKGNGSDIVHVWDAVSHAQSEAATWEEFGKLLEAEGVTYKKKDTRKNIVFEYNGRKYRDSNLSKTFNDGISKESIGNAIQQNYINSEQQRAEYAEYAELEAISRESDRTAKAERRADREVYSRFGVRANDFSTESAAERATDSRFEEMEESMRTARGELEQLCDAADAREERAREAARVAKEIARELAEAEAERARRKEQSKTKEIERRRTTSYHER